MASRRWLLTCLLVLRARSALAADYDLAIDRVDLAPDPGGNGLYFGGALAAGDFDGDGYRDLGIGAFGLDTVYLYSGSPEGLLPESRTELTELPSEEHDGNFFGGALVSFDWNGDGFDDLAVTAEQFVVPGVFLYSGSASGVAQSSEVYFAPIDRSPAHSASAFGAGLGNAGDTDGDGLPELMVADPLWRSEADFTAGAVFIYPGSTSGIDVCGERRLGIPDRPDYGDTELGQSLAGNGDVNGDGYAELVATCSTCGDPAGPDTGYISGKVFVWNGGAGGAGSTEPTFILQCCSVDILLDVDDDGFDELAVTEPDGTIQLYYGASEALDSEPHRTLRAPLGSGIGVGDVDGDDLGDLVLDVGEEHDAEGVVFGDRSRPEAPTPLLLNFSAAVLDGWSRGGGQFALGDINADGHADFALASEYAGLFEGAVSVYAPVCTWYADADGDGFGRAAVSTNTCHNPGVGWAAHADDCDDVDPTVHGSTWFLDADGDGYGTRPGAVLACAQPPGTSASWQDCDDHDATRSPGLDDPTADGSDQDCDGNDGPWIHDTGDCSSGSTEDSGADTSESTDTAPGDDAASPAIGQDCGCAASGSPTVPGLLALAVCAAFRGSRRR